MKRQWDEMFASEQEEGSNSLSRGSLSSEEEVGMKSFTIDLRKQFKGLDDVCVAGCGGWSAVKGQDQLTSMQR